MIEEGSYSYKTRNGKGVILLPRTRNMGGTRVYIGIIEGYQNYFHWTEDGSLFGEKDRNLDITEKVSANANPDS